MRTVELYSGLSMSSLNLSPSLALVKHQMDTVGGWRVLHAMRSTPSLCNL